MISNDVRTVELLMDNINQGLVYVDRDRIIRSCNRVAKEITGIIFNAHYNHDAGSLNEGDIVVLADNMLGGDDGELTGEDLDLLNIKDKDIKHGDVLLAVGVYKNGNIHPEYKYMRNRNFTSNLRLDTNYLGMHIVASVDLQKKETLIEVNDSVYRLGYYNTVCNMVIIDGTTGAVKFFQAKGYSVRNEDPGKILRGDRWHKKTTEILDVDVSGRRFLDLFDESALSQILFAVLDGQSEGVNNRLYEINRRPFVCNVVPWYDDGEQTPVGAFLMLQDAQNLEHMVNDRNEIIKQMEASKEEHDPLPPDAPEGIFEGFAGKSSKTKEVKYMAWKASKGRFNVIITGESGTGKSKLAREIHMASNPDAPFVEVNCNAIAPTLFESELFGYVGGAFTGAKNEGKLGFFEAADKGTIFLDEIGEIPLDIQVKLLHVLQNKIIYRVGSSKPIKVDVRVIAATNKNLEEEVEMGKFRQDLFYRINVFPIEIPPIRERKGDLYLLINQILKSVCENYGLEQKQFSGEAIQKMIVYNWPGNVRELENAIERAVTLCDSNIIYPEHLRIGKGEIPTTLKGMMEKEEERILEMTLLKYNGDKQKAMKELEVSKTAFYEKLKKYNIK